MIGLSYAQEYISIRLKVALSSADEGSCAGGFVDGITRGNGRAQ